MFSASCISNLKMSLEPNRTEAYSSDLRWRMVGKSLREVAQNLGVAPSTVSRTISLFYGTSAVEKQKYPPNRGTAALTEVDKILILESAIERPGIYLREIRQLLLDETGTDIHVSTIWRFLKSLHFTRQKMVLIAKQRSELLRVEFRQEMSVFIGHPDMLVFIDETGADRRNCLRKFAYSIRGKPALCQKLLVRGQRVSAIAAMSTEGILDCYTYFGSVTGDKFKHFIQNSLLPHLQPFNGVNSRSIVVLDNAAIHHASGVVDLIESTGAVLASLQSRYVSYRGSILQG